MPDGSVIVVEMFGPRLTRLHPDGRQQTVGEIPGGPNGAAKGPGNLVYVCNNGARFTEMAIDGICIPGPCTTKAYLGGRIQTVDLSTGQVTDLYTECEGRPLWAPNDLVFDGHGGFYFTDYGLIDDEKRISHLSGIYYAKNDGSGISEVVFPAHEPNGIGLSPDGSKLYWSETWNGRIMQRDVAAPGQLIPVSMVDASACLYGFPGFQLLDSLAVDGDGNVCVATLINGGISVVTPDGKLIEFVATGDMLTTNICFGGDDLTTAYITASGTGKLLKMDWPRSGARLHHLNG
jgi:gluconolactonase